MKTKAYYFHFYLWVSLFVLSSNCVQAKSVIHHIVLPYQGCLEVFDSRVSVIASERIKFCTLALEDSSISNAERAAYFLSRSKAYFFDFNFESALTDTQEGIKLTSLDNIIVGDPTPISLRVMESIVLRKLGKNSEARNRSRDLFDRFPLIQTVANLLKFTHQTSEEDYEPTIGLWVMSSRLGVGSDSLMAFANISLNKGDYDSARRMVISSIFLKPAGKPIENQLYILTQIENQSGNPLLAYELSKSLRKSQAKKKVADWQHYYESISQPFSEKKIIWYSEGDRVVIEQAYAAVQLDKVEEARSLLNTLYQCISMTCYKLKLALAKKEGDGVMLSFLKSQNLKSNSRLSYSLSAEQLVGYLPIPFDGTNFITPVKIKVDNKEHGEKSKTLSTLKIAIHRPTDKMTLRQAMMSTLVSKMKADRIEKVIIKSFLNGVQRINKREGKTVISGIYEGHIAELEYYALKNSKSHDLFNLLPEIALDIQMIENSSPWIQKP